MLYGRGQQQRAVKTERTPAVGSRFKPLMKKKHALRLFAAGKITETVWDGLWREWQDRQMLPTIWTLRCARENTLIIRQRIAHNLEIGVLYQQLNVSSKNST
jgi:hypothetical protein